MSIASLLVRAPEISIDGAPHRVLFDHAALIELERLTGRNVLAGEIDLGRPSMKLLRAALASGAHIPVSKAGTAITVKTAAAVHRVIIQAWEVSMPEPEEGHGDDGAPRQIQTWLDAWAIARYDLRLSDQEWLDMTPRQVQALRFRQLEQMRREEVLTGIIASTGANFSHCRPKQALKAEDFMLHPFPVKPVTAEDLMRVFAHFPNTKGGYGVQVN